jgi:hypothetical protein
MPTTLKKKTINKFPLRLMPSIRKTAEEFSAKEGVSLNQFINVAVAERLAQLRHEEWSRNRKKPDNALIARALQILDEGSPNPPEAGDELPAGYRSVKEEYAKLTSVRRRA